MNDAVVRILKESVPDLVAVYLFGSTATGATHAASDVDLAFLATRALPNVERFELQERIAVAVRRSVDLVDLQAASTVMRLQVVSQGRLLFEADAAERGRFEDRVFSAYARLNEERGAILRQVLRERSIHAR